jgi:hypothetical protein
MGNFTQPSAERSYDLENFRCRADGAASVSVVIKNAAGRPVDQFNITLPVSGPVFDENGNQVAAQVRNGTRNAITALLLQLQTDVDALAAAGRFER